MKQVELTPALQWEQLLQDVKNEDVVLTHEGRAVALLSDFDDEEMYWYARERDPEFLASLSRAREQVRHGKIVTHEDVKRQLGIE